MAGKPKPKSKAASRVGGARPNSGRPAVSPTEPTAHYAIRLPLSVARGLRALPTEVVRRALISLARKHGEPGG